MRIVMDALPPQGLDLKVGLQDEWARAAAQIALEAPPTVLDLDLRVMAVDHDARVRGQGRCVVPATCGRCGEALVFEVGGDIDLSYARPGAAGTDPVELEADDLDVGWFDGHHLDLADVLSEQLGLWLPLRIVCGGPGVTRPLPGPCELPHQDPGPDLSRQNPFAVLKRSE